MSRYFLLIILIISASFLRAQNPDPLIELTWAQDSAVVGSQVDLQVTIDDLERTPGVLLWDTTVVVPMDTSLKGSQLDGLWEMSGDIEWRRNNNGQWTSTIPIQFWNAGLFYYSGVSIMSEDSTLLLTHQADLQTAMIVQYPTSLRQSQEIVGLIDIIPARHSHAESWIRLLWPGLLWTAFALFSALLFGKKEYLIKKKNNILLSASRWWKETALIKSNDQPTADDYAELSRRLRYWMEEGLKIPAKEWTTAQLEQYAHEHNSIEKEKLEFLNRVDSIVYGFGTLDPEVYKTDKEMIMSWTESYARQMDKLERSLEEVEPILPEEVYNQTIETLNIASRSARCIAFLINALIYLIPLLLITVLSGCTPYLKVLKDSYGDWTISLMITLIVLFGFILLDAFWNYYHTQTPGSKIMQHRLTVYSDYSPTFSRQILRSSIKVITAPLFVIQLMSGDSIATQDRLTHCYQCESK